jgi:S-adenosylmethionine decarboxylase
MHAFAGTSFEGSEKKVELILDRSLPSLRGWGDGFWESVCQAARTEILSRIDDEGSIAYLLSESSLFVFDHQVIMLTCGRTTLHGGVIELLHAIPPDRIEMLVYQRKNESFPHSQRTSFFEDVSAMHERLPGRAFRFGDEDGHHLYLFHLDRPFSSDPADVTVEILMYGVDEAVRREFSRHTQRSTEGLRERTGIDRILPGFRVDDHLFQPGGYSLNALRGASYYTVHVTPEDQASYASFETNCPLGRDPGELVSRVLDIFRPRSFDLVVFDHDEPQTVPAQDGFTLTSHVVQPLAVGYRVRFMSFLRPRSAPVPALELPLRERPQQVG